MNNEIPIILKRNITAKKIKIYPISDLHVGSAECNMRAWENFIDKVKSEDESYLIIAGDMLNNGLKSSVTNVYEEVMRPKMQQEYLYETLLPVSKKIIAGCSGNHERRSLKDCDIDPLNVVFNRLGIGDVYRTQIAYVFLNTKDRYAENGIELSGSKRPAYTIAVTHGHGGGSYIGGSGNKAEKFNYSFDGLDLLIVGHTHKPIMFPTRKIVLDTKNKKISYRSSGVCVATSWLEYGGYPVEKLLTPVATGVLQEIELYTDRKKIKISQEY